MAIETITDEMVKSAIEKLLDTNDLPIFVKPCQYSPRGYCMRDETKAECSQNYHCCDDYIE